MSVRVMLARTKLLNITNQTRYVQMSLTRRIIKDEACPHTLAYLVRPNPRFRSQELKSSFPIATRHGPISMFHCGLKLLSNCHWMRDKGNDKNDAFKVMAKEYILSSYDNKNV